MLREREPMASELLGRRENQLYIKPHPLLRRYIAHYTVTFPGTEPLPAQLSLIPDASGCLVFTCSNMGIQGEYWGSTTQVVVVENDANKVPMRLFVEFLPGGAHRIMGFPQDETTDIQLPLDVLNPALERSICGRIEAAADLGGLLRSLDEVMLSQMGLSQGNQFLDRLFRGTQRAPAIPTVRDLTERTCYSERHLNRLFHQSVGMSMKVYLRLLRINRAVLAMERGGKSFTRLAQDLGYYDQAHFIHDFQRVCGVAPKDYMKNLSVFYNETYKC